MSNHICDSIIVCCIDFRFQKYIRSWIDENLKNKTYDLVGFAGSTKDLETILKQIDISVRLHEVKEIILIHHENCGAYGAEGILENHTRDLLKAQKIIKKKYPRLKIKLFYLLLNGQFQEIEQ